MSRILQEPNSPASDPKKAHSKLLPKVAMLAAMSSVFVSPYGGKVSPTASARLSTVPMYLHERSSQAGMKATETDIGDSTDEPASIWSACCLRRDPKARGRMAKAAVASDDSDTPLLDVENNPMQPLPRHLRSDAIRSLVSSAQSGFGTGVALESLSEGMGGVYAVADAANRRVGVFKPSDEEVGCEHNPKGNSPRHAVANARPGVEPGMCMYREVAASVLDDGFAGVPPTCLVRLTDPARGARVGSLQAFVPCSGVAGDMGCSRFAVSDVQRIAALDMRVMNLDRHDANILIREDPSGVRLVPIDHGLCFPSRMEVADFEWCWLDWPQTKAAVDPALAAYIAAIDVDADLARLAALNIPLSPAAQNVLRTSTQFLKLGVAAGLTLHEIASAMVRTDADTPSVLERAVLRANWRALARTVLDSSLNLNEEKLKEIEKVVAVTVASLAVRHRGSW